MNNAQRQLRARLHDNVDSFENYFGNEVPSTSMPGAVKPSLVPQRNNPPFTAQFDLQFITKYYTLTGGVYTEIAAAAVNAALRNSLPFFVFGNSDFASGFSKLKGQYPINANWSYGRPGIYGKDDFEELAFDSTVIGSLQNGDLVLPFTSTLPGAGTTTLALNIIRCNTVAYGTLLDALNSDRFVLNGIRYTLDDTTQLAQFNNQIGMFLLSLFGKFNSDFVSPASYKDPKQFQDGIVDIPLKYGIEKGTSLAFYNNYTNVAFGWSIYVLAKKELSI